MLNDFIPCVSFPTKVYLLDDNPNFLANLTFKLDEHFNCETQTQPEKALDYFLKEHKPPNFEQRLINPPHDSDQDNVSVAIDITKIRAELENPHRFDLVSTLLVDFQMPRMNGMTVCKQLKNIPLKKMMLTAEADYEIAVNGFNEGNIDKFILKSDENIFEKLRVAIQELQQQFFHDQSRVIIADITAGHNSCLIDPVFISFFNQLCIEKKIIEYYLIARSGSFLLLDKKANPTWLVVKNTQEMHDYYDIAKQNGNASSIATALKRKEKIPFLLEGESEQVAVQNWNPYLFPAHKLTGKADYYYAVVENSPLHSLQQNNHPKIMSYDDYLKSR